MDTCNPSRLDPFSVAQLIDSFAVVQILCAAVKLQLPAHLVHGSITDEELSERTHVSVRKLRSLLRALATLGVIRLECHDTYIVSSSPISDALLPGGQLHGHVVLSAGAYYSAWAHLTKGLTAEVSAFERCHGTNLWKYLNDHHEEADHFALMMHHNSIHFWTECDPTIFGNGESIVDLGAGDATLIAEVLKHHPHLHGIAVEQGNMVARAQQTIDRQHLSDRCRVVESDIFATVPAGGSTYVLKSVLHNWNERDALRVLATVRDAMTSTARLVIIERNRDDTATRVDVALRDLTMVVLFDAYDRSDRECRSLISSAGLVLTRTSRTRSGMDIYEAQRNG